MFTLHGNYPIKNAKNNIMGQKISQFIFNLFGWKATVETNNFPPKYIVIVLPHTSNWDFPKGILARRIIGQDIKFIAKDSLFKGPLGVLMRALGGYPVDRSKHGNFVDAVVALFNSKEQFIITITPEGTRKKVEKLKSGFYYIAKGANVPVVLCKFDYENKEIHFSAPRFVKDSLEEEIAYLGDYFQHVKGKIPEFGYLYNERQKEEK